jgi:hypothetical protein
MSVAPATAHVKRTRGGFSMPYIRLANATGDFVISGDEVFRIEVTDGVLDAKFPGLQWEMAGRIVHSPDELNGAPFWQFVLEDGKVTTGQVWLQRIVMPSRTVSVEIRWRPEHGLTTMLCNLDASPHEIKQAQAAYRYVAVRTRCGRPLGTGTFRTPEDFVETIRKALEEMEEKKIRLTQEELVKFLCIHSDYQRYQCGDVRIFRRWQRDFGFRDFKQLIGELGP